MSKKNLELTNKIVDKYAVLEEVVLSYEVNDDNIPTDKPKETCKSFYIPETLLGLNIAGFGDDEDRARKDLVEKLEKVLDSGDINLSDTWESDNL